MKQPKSRLKVIILFAFLTSLAISIEAQIKKGSDTAPGNPAFDFSIFFTGNIQGNIEPCG